MRLLAALVDEVFGQIHVFPLAGGAGAVILALALWIFGDHLMNATTAALVVIS